MPTPKVEAVRVAFRILGSFRGPGEWVSCAELGQRAGLSVSAACRLVLALVEAGVLVQDVRGRFRLNPGFKLYSGDTNETQSPSNSRIWCVNERQQAAE